MIDKSPLSPTSTTPPLSFLHPDVSSGRRSFLSSGDGASRPSIKGALSSGRSCETAVGDSVVSRAECLVRTYWTWSIKVDQPALVGVPELSVQSQRCGRVRGRGGPLLRLRTAANIPPATFYIVAGSRGDSGCHGEIYRRLRETVHDSPTPLPRLGGH